VSGRWEKLAWTVALSRCYNMSIQWQTTSLCALPGKLKWFIVVTKGFSRPDGTFPIRQALIIGTAIAMGWAITLSSLDYYNVNYAIHWFPVTQIKLL